VSTLLELERVHKRCGQGRGRIVLGEVSLELEAGELTVVWGLRGSGRSTLLRIAAGIEPPDGGVVRFEGRDLAGSGAHALGQGIGFCQRRPLLGDARTALEQGMVGPLAQWLSPARARSRTQRALERVGAAHCAAMSHSRLTSSESVRVALACALALEPKLVVIDEPTRGVELAQRDQILALLRSLADEGTAVLASTGQSTGLSQADQALTIGDGRVFAAHSSLAPVIALRPGLA
jgi:ABC-type multidrug transport system ATPase subunit